jgi:hypothetical protein
MSAKYLDGVPAAAAARCTHCRHWLRDRAAVEQRLAGMQSFGSAYGAAIAESRLCQIHDCWSAPEDTCAQFRLAD